VLVTPGDTLANTFQKTFRRWLLDTLAPEPATEPGGTAKTPVNP